jgi:hypothetical protein
MALLRHVRHGFDLNLAGRHAVTPSVLLEYERILFLRNSEAQGSARTFSKPVSSQITQLKKLSAPCTYATSAPARTTSRTLSSPQTGLPTIQQHPKEQKVSFQSFNRNQRREFLTRTFGSSYLWNSEPADKICLLDLVK